MKNDLFIKNKIWIHGKNGNFLGEGRVALLEAIEESGSISKAAKSMNMSYRKAWQLVDSMNKEATNPLVIKVSGGEGGGGSVLTDHGKKAIKIFKEIRNKCEKLLAKEISNINTLLNEV